MIKQATGATHCYFGVKGMREVGPAGEPAVPTITFVAGTEGSNMADACLVGVDPEGDPDAKPEGVTFDLFKGREVPPPPPAEGEPEPEVPS